jgi:homoserine O-acetyltransferase
VGRARGGVDAALRGLKQPALVIGVTSDVLYPISEQERLAKTLPHAEYAVLESDEGHDAFLINIKWMQDQLLAFFRKHMPQLFHAPRL